MSKFKIGEAIVFDPQHNGIQGQVQRDEIVYFLGNIPNCPGHGIVVTINGVVIPMIHPDDFRTATEDEL